MIDYFSYLLLNKMVLFPYFFLQFMLNDGQLRTSFGVFRYGAKVSFVKIEQTPSHGKKSASERR